MSKCSLKSINWKHFFLRLVLYQSLVILGIYELDRGEYFISPFKDKMKSLSKSLGLPEKLYKQFGIGKTAEFYGFQVYIIVVSVFGSFGIRFFQVLTGLAEIFVAFLYHNPIVEIQNLISKKIPLNTNNFKYYLPSLSCLLYFTLGFLILSDAFRSEEKKEKTETEEIKNENRENISKENKKVKGESKENHSNESKDKGKKGNKGKKKKE